MELKFKDMDGIDEVTITKIHIKVGDKIKKGDNIIDIEADKASDVIKSEEDGIINKIFVKEGEIIKSGMIIAELNDQINNKINSSSINSEQINLFSSSSSELKQSNIELIKPKNKILATPLARKMAFDLNIDMKLVKGTGPMGRILKSDLLDYKSNILPKIANTNKEQNNACLLPKSSNIDLQNINIDKIKSFGTIEYLPFSGIRKAIANQMSLSFYTAPHVSLIINVHAEKLVQLRISLKEPAEKDPDGGAKLTFMPFFIKAVAKTLKEERFKLLNSTLNISNNEIIVKKYYNIGIAADTEKGLVVPVIKNADKLSLFEIARQVNLLADKARKGLLKSDEMQGSSFTITNFGSAGIEIGTPIINYPEVAILGLGMIQKKLIIIDNKIVEHSFFPLSLSIDHRIVDGAPAGYFLSRIKELLENPTLILT